MKDKQKKQRRKDDSPWGWYNYLIYEVYGPKMGAIGIALYIAYTRYAYGKKQIVWPSMATIMEKLNITKPTLIKYNNILEKYKLIKIDKSDGISNRITILKVKEVTGSKNTLLVKGSKAGLLGSKAGLLVPVKVLYSNKKKKNKKKEEYTPAASGGTRLKKEMFKGCTPSERDSFDKFTDILITLLRSKRKIMKRPNPTRWKKQFILLHRDGISRKIIRKTLKWYKEHIGEQFVPDIRTAGGFRTKFNQLVAAQERYEVAEETGEVDYGARRKHKKNKRVRQD